MYLLILNLFQDILLNKIAAKLQYLNSLYPKLLKDNKIKLYIYFLYFCINSLPH